jgi:hypothetical protein
MTKAGANGCLIYLKPDRATYAPARGNDRFFNGIAKQRLMLDAPLDILHRVATE